VEKDVLGHHDAGSQAAAAYQRARPDDGAALQRAVLYNTLILNLQGSASKERWCEQRTLLGPGSEHGMCESKRLQK
jgi:hypothetical protein